MCYGNYIKTSEVTNMNEDMNILDYIDYLMDEMGLPEEIAEREASIYFFGYCEED